MIIASELFIAASSLNESELPVDAKPFVSVIIPWIVAPGFPGTLSIKGEVV